MAKTSEEIKKVETELEFQKSLVALHNKNVERLSKRLKLLKRSLRVKEIIIGDHAIVSYMKRFKREVFGMTIEEVGYKLRAMIQEDALKIGGNGKITKGEVTFVIKNHKVVTIYNQKNRD